MFSTEIEIVKSFIRAINCCDLNVMSNLMTEDHTFTDSGGTVETGREKMIEGWKEYFKMFPDFNIKADEFLQRGNMIAVFGSTTGTYNGKRGLVPENRVGGPAAWKAIVENGKVKYWQVYTDWAEGTKVIEEDQM
jgi:limonene-1,2-epoxide hydrolase